MSRKKAKLKRLESVSRESNSRSSTELRTAIGFRFFYLLNGGVHVASTYLGPDSAFDKYPALTLAGVGLMAASSIGAISCHLYRSAQGQLHQEGTDFLQDGPYRFVRHPVYSGYRFFHLSLMLQNPSLLNIAIGAGVLLSLEGTARMEEVAMQQKFPTYEAYRERTPRWIPKAEAVKEKTLEILLAHPKVDYALRAIQLVFH